MIKTRQFRIKTVNCSDGQVEYYPQLKCWFGWFNLTLFYSIISMKTTIAIGPKYKCNCRKDAFDIIQEFKRQKEPLQKKTYSITYELIT